MQIPNDRGISTKKCNGGNAMGITGVGSSYNFVYNTKTGKLSTKDGSKNEFVDFCNGAAWYGKIHSTGNFKWTWLVINDDR